MTATHWVVTHRRVELGFETVKIVCVIPFFLGQALNNPALTLGGLLGASAVFAVEVAPHKASGGVNFPLTLGFGLATTGLNLAVTALYLEPLGLVHLGVQNKDFLFLGSGLSFIAGIICLWITILVSDLWHKSAG